MKTLLAFLFISTYAAILFGAAHGITGCSTAAGAIALGAVLVPGVVALSPEIARDRRWDSRVRSQQRKGEHDH